MDILHTTSVNIVLQHMHNQAACECPLALGIYMYSIDLYRHKYPNNV